MSVSTNPVLRSLHTLRRRLRLQTFVGSLSRAVLALGAGLLAVAVLNRFALDRLPWDGRLAAVAALGALLLALGRAYARPLPLSLVARHFDRLGATRDRFVTTLTFSESAPPTMQTLALQECTAYLGRRDFRALVPVRWPRETLWVLAPFVALAFLQWDALQHLKTRLASQAAARAEVAGTVEALAQLAREAEKKAQQSEDPALKALAEKLKEAARDLQAQAAQNKEQAAKAALRQLSALEQWAREMQKAAVSPEELKALAQALDKNEATKEAAAALQAGNLAEAAKSLEEAAKKDEPSAEKAGETLKEAVERLAQQKQRSEALEKLAQQMRQSAASQDPKSGDALQRLAEMLKQMPRNGQKPGDSKSGQQQLSQQNLQDLLAALQNMKFGDKQDSGKDGQPGKPGEQGAVAMESFGPPGEGSTPTPGSADSPSGLPSGMPGSERDLGTTETPFGDKNPGPDKKGADTALKGRLGEGESLSTLTPAAAGGEKAGRRYKELYEAMAPDAQAAVMQEEIPLGSRFFIQRYFESIRP